MIKTWSDCSLQAKFAYVDREPQKQSASATFGTCIHDALELYNENGDMDEAVARFLDTWENPEKLGVTPDFWHKRVTYSGLRETGVKILLDYHESASWHQREILAQEHKFCVPFGEHQLSGIVDVLEAKKGDRKKLRIVDYKTAGTRPNYDSLYLNIQFTIYVYASMQPEFWLGFDDGTPESKAKDGSPKYAPMENGEELFERFKNAERVPIWYHLRQNKEINCGARDDADFMRLYRACQEIEKALEHDVFVPNISGNTCTMCSYTNICKAYIPPREEP